MRPSRRLIFGTLLLAGACVLAVEETVGERAPDGADAQPQPAAPAPATPPETDAASATKAPCDRAPRVVTVPRDAGPDADGGDAGTMEIVVYEDCVAAPPKDLGDPPPGRR
jgi:hypothetical protein